MKSTEPLPTFHELRLQYDISLETIYEYADQGISLNEIQLFDETGRANPSIADDLLFALSELSGPHYDRTNVRGIIFVLARPPASPIAPQPQPGYLPAQPALLDLHRAYNLDLNWIGEALMLSSSEVWANDCWANDSQTATSSSTVSPGGFTIHWCRLYARQCTDQARSHLLPGDCAVIS